MLLSKPISRITAVALAWLVFYAAGYVWFVRGHTERLLSSDVIEVSDSPFDCALLFVFYPALWLDTRYLGFWDTGRFTHFIRVHASDRVELEGTQIYPFATVGDYPLPPESDTRQFLLMGSSLVCNAILVFGAVYLATRLNRNERSA